MALRNQEIAQRIRQLRERKGNPPQPIVAAAIHVSLRTYQNWEAGDAKPEYRNLEALAAYYGVSEEYILTGAENAQPESPVVVSEQMDEGFGEFRKHVEDLHAHQTATTVAVIERIDRLELGVATNRELLEAIAGLVDRQDKILANIEMLLARQDRMLAELQRAASGLPRDETIEALRLELEAVEGRARAASTQRPSTATATGRARRSQP